jgi:hypothetical protein
VFGRSLRVSLPLSNRSRSDRPRRVGDFCHVPGHSRLAAVGDVRKRTRLSEQRRIPVQRAFNYRDSNGPKPTHLGLGQKSSGVRMPQHKISHLAESFEAIWGVDGHEHVQIPGNR